LAFYFGFDRGERQGVFSFKVSLPAAHPAVSGNGLSGPVVPAA